jgi:disulfide bond formation protein DsbB
MSDSNSIVTDSISLIVRVIGLIVLLVGLYIGLKVIFEAWHLYEQPQRIERFATAIEQGSHLDSLLSSLANKSETSVPTDDVQAITNKPPPIPSIRLTYSLAWGIAVLLLMVIGSLAATAIQTGGQLALYDLQVKQLAKQLGQQSHTKQKD